MSTTSPLFGPRGTEAEIEEGTVFAPKFDADGLIPVVATDANTGDVLMFAWMNAEALEKTIRTGDVWYWSRSRKALWRKGETSGQTQSVRDIRIDCDQDALVIKVEVGGDGGACHVGYRSCFFRSVPVGPADGPLTLRIEDAKLPGNGHKHP
ncbi:MAG: phosphoribosyl-AMP cyclohydrolase [Parvibaculum sp.]|uniref:phosphoribosyl-AMP cyclohydrolase n=1 Tax=Parvibaculum sp. TaxID=2024848 RepID=UPI003C786C19